MKKSSTIYDIAERLGFSASTVSRALANNPRISLKTRKLVAKEASKLGYNRNKYASNLRRGKGETIGVIVPRINRSFFASVIHGIEEELYKKNYNLIICQSKELLSREQQCVRLLIDSSVDGIIYSASAETTSFNHVFSILNARIPLVQFDRVLKELSTNSVINDNDNGAYKATKHLIEQGYKKIAHLHGPLNLSVYQERKSGYEMAMNEAALEVKKDWVLPAITEVAGREAGEKLLSIKDRPDAIFCASDFSALGALKEAKDKGVCVPKDLGVVGFANEPFCEMVHPGLTSVEQFSESIGRESAKMVLDQIHHKNSEQPVQVRSCSVELKVRESSLRSM